VRTARLCLVADHVQLWRSRSELCALRTDQIGIDRNSYVHLHGKGRKERAIPLWPSTARVLKDWLRENTGGIAFLPPDFFVHVVLELRPAAGHVLGLGSGLLDRFRLALIAAIAPYLCFLAVQQVGQYVIEFRRRRQSFCRTLPDSLQCRCSCNPDHRLRSQARS
jgi:integrase